MVKVISMALPQRLVLDLRESVRLRTLYLWCVYHDPQTITRNLAILKALL